VTNLLSPTTLLAYASIPAVCAFVGWFTNWVAVKMTFYPVRFIGIAPFLGWQGVVPRKAAKIAGRAVDLFRSRLLAKDDLFGGLDREGLIAELVWTLDPVLDEVARTTLARQGGRTWDEQPPRVRADILGAMREHLAQALRDLGAELAVRLDDFLDIRALIVASLTGENAHVLNEMFLRCGHRELRFIELSGVYIGAAIGLAQAAAWRFYPRWWLLPITGAIVGYVTNWVALKMIFRPLEPRRFLGFTYQGMFLRRQVEISREYADVVAKKVLTAPKIVDNVVHGAGAGALRAAVARHVAGAIDGATGFAHGTLGVVLATIPPEAHREMKDLMVRAVLDRMPACATVVERHLRGAIDIENLIYPRLRNLPKPEFEDILHSCFKEDELILIAIGGVLGFAIGLAQGAYLVRFPA
jgi:uncharacterized membrane protein YheB (UPF0754 family)